MLLRYARNQTHLGPSPQRLSASADSQLRKNDAAHLSLYHFPVKVARVVLKDKQSGRIECM